MKMTVRLVLTFGTILILTVVMTTGLLMANSYALMVSSAKDAAVVLIRTFESQALIVPNIQDSELQDRVTNLLKSLPEIQELNLYRIGGENTAIASNDPENLGKAADPEDLTAAQNDQTVVLFSRDSGEFLIDVTAPLHKDGQVALVIGLQLDLKADESALVGFFIGTAAIAVVAILVALLLIALTARALIRPLSDMSRVLQTMRETEDLRARLPVKTQDETGELSRSFNAFLDTLAGLVQGLKVSETEIAGIADHLADHASRTDHSVQGIHSNLASLQKEIGHLNESMGRSSDAVTQSTEGIVKLEQAISNQAGSVSEASAAIEQVLGNIASVTTLAGKMADQFVVVTRASEDGKIVQKQTAALVQEISLHSVSLMDANKAIAKIASQTNLLAMNAAIEAAHAGDAGRGFSVVADEIRQLAENASSQSQVIRGDIGAVQKAIENLVQSSGRLGQAFDQVDTKITETGEIVQTVQNAMAEQGEGSKHVLQVIERLNSLTHLVQEGAASVTNGNRIMTEEITGLHDNTAQIDLSVSSTAQGVEAFSQAVHEIASTVETVRNTIHGIEKTLGRLQV